MKNKKSHDEFPIKASIDEETKNDFNETFDILTKYFGWYNDKNIIDEKENNNEDALSSYPSEQNFLGLDDFIKRYPISQRYSTKMDEETAKSILRRRC